MRYDFGNFHQVHGYVIGKIFPLGLGNNELGKHLNVQILSPALDGLRINHEISFNGVHRSNYWNTTIRLIVFQFLDFHVRVASPLLF